MLDRGVEINQAGQGAGYGLTTLQTAALTKQEKLVYLKQSSKYKCHTSDDDYKYAILQVASFDHFTCR